MRISIDVDLEPSEFPLAHELLQTLRLLTEHVKVKGRPSGSGQAPAAASQHVPPPAAVPVAAAPQAAPVPAPVAAPVAAPVPAAPPLPNTPEEARQMFMQLISRLGGKEGPAQLDTVAAEAARVLGAPGPMPSQTLIEQFNEALCAVAFDKGNIARQQSAEAFLMVLPRLPETIRAAVKKCTISWVLNFLNQKRPVDVDRESVYLQADAFAVLVQMDMVAADGAVQAMAKLLKPAEKRVAAVMTLCALVQRCKDKIKSANPGFLEEALALLVTHAMADHRPAVEYVYGQLGRPLPQAPAAAPMPAPATAPQQQQPSPQAAAGQPPGAEAALPTAPQSLTVQHTATISSPVNAASPGEQGYHSIFSVAYDPFSQLMMSGGIDVPIALWSPDGRVQHQIPMPNNFFVSSIHLEPQNRMLIVCGAANSPDPAVPGRVALFDARPGAGYKNVGNVVRSDIISLAGVDTIPGTSHMLVAELLSTQGMGANLVALYDFNRVVQSGTHDHQPLQRFIGHMDVVTAVAAGEGIFKECFLSASKDRNVMVWDTRSQQPTPVATLGVKAGEQRTTHTDMVTCVDVCGFNVMTASLDGTVALWDLRKSDSENTITAVCAAGNESSCLRNGVIEKWNTHGVVKAAMRGAPYDRLVAAATVQGLYLLDMSVAQPVAKMLDVGPMDPKTNFCEVKWCSATGRLLAATGMGATFELLECRV